ncbi:MAG: hypothetical protein RL660_999 [Bacteroidota bacterium]|jgi:uracil-DNA glycosylase
MAVEVQIEESWKAVLSAEFEQAYFDSLVNFIKEQKAKGSIIYPQGKDIFNAFTLSTWENTRVVILGQDPYHGPQQAHGLCFSVQNGVAVPPSLQNIYKELYSDIGCAIPSHGNLTYWAQQGVLLLNTSLTVEASKPMSHSKIGWEQFTDAVIRAIDQHKQNVVFILWGSFAQKKAAFVDATKHLVLKCAHPSPLSAHNGFWGNKHFSKTNAYLQEHGLLPIDWQIT